MTVSDRKTLWHFILRPGMYLVQDDATNIISFMHGYDAARGKGKWVSANLSEYIESVYQLKPGAQGWPGQVEMLAGQLQLNWTVVFRRTLMDMLLAEVGSVQRKKMEQSVRENIRPLVNKIPGPWAFQSSWIFNWLVFCRLDEPWFTALWSPEELTTIISMHTIIQRYKGGVVLEEEDRLKLCWLGQKIVS